MMCALLMPTAAARMGLTSRIALALSNKFLALTEIGVGLFNLAVTIAVSFVDGNS
jgi:hypothetical protein